MTLSGVKLDFYLYFPRKGNSDCNVVICLYNFVFKLIFANVENRNALLDRYAEGSGIIDSPVRGCLHNSSLLFHLLALHLFS